MRIVNRTKVEQVFGGITLQPGETWEDGETVKPDPLDHDFDGKKGGSKPKRGRPRKEK